MLPSVASVVGNAKGTEGALAGDMPEQTVVSGIYPCSFPPGEQMTLQMWLSENPTHSLDAPDGAYIWTVNDASLRYDSSSPEIQKSLCLTQDASKRPEEGSHRCTAPDAQWLSWPSFDNLVSKNGTLFIHGYLTSLANGNRAEMHTLLTRVMPPPAPEKYKNLLESSSEERAELLKLRNAHEKLAWISYWKENATIQFVADMPAFDMAKTPIQITKLLSRDDISRTFSPVFYINDFWTYTDHFYPLNSTVSALPLTLTFGPMGLWKWQLFSQMEESFKTQMEWG